MATRAVIKIEGVNFAQVYKHWDGYPEDMLPWLEEFNRRFLEKRGDDPTYKFAQLLRFSSKYAEYYNLDNDEFTGWGVIPYNENAGADYEYILKKDGKVKVNNT